MASLSHILISTVLTQGMSSYRALMSKGFQTDWLRDPEIKEVWELVRKYTATYRDVPTENIIRSRFPHFHYLPYQEVMRENVVALSDLLRENYAQIQFDHALQQAIKLNASDPVAALEWMSQRVGEIRRHAVDVAITNISSMESIEEVEDEMEGRGDNSRIFPYAWPTVQEETMGMKGGELVLLYGRPKSMKSFLALYLACHAYLYSGARVLVISREMPAQQCRSRVIAILAEVAYGPWRKRRLTDHQKQHVMSILNSLMHYEQEMYDRTGRGPCFQITETSFRSAYKGMDFSQAMMDHVEPDIVLDDSVYLAAGEGTDSMDWRVQASVIQSAKVKAKDNKVVYLATTQASRPSRSTGGGKKKKNETEEQEKERKQNEKIEGVLDDLTDLNNLAFADAYAQNCDLAIRTVLLPEYKTILLGFPGARENELGIVPINAIPCSNFKEISKSEGFQRQLHPMLMDELFKEDLHIDLKKPVFRANPDKDPELTQLTRRSGSDF